MSRPILSCVSLLFGLLLPLCGQNHAAERAQPKPFEGEGTIEAAAGNLLQVKTNTNETLKVFVPPAALVQLTGTATADFLRSGIYVEFVAEVGKNGIAKDKISQVTIFTPRRDIQPGLYPEGEAMKPKGNEGKGEGTVGKGNEEGGAAPLFGEGAAKGIKGKAIRKSKGPAGGGDAAADLFGIGSEGPSGGKAGAKRGGGNQVQLPAVCTVRGRITAWHAPNLTVSPGRGVIKAELDENVEISVDVGDCSLAVRGDKIVIKGKELNKQVLAESVKIEAAQPLDGGGAKKVRGKTATTKPLGKTKLLPKKGAGNAVDSKEAAEKLELFPPAEKTPE